MNPAGAPVQRPPDAKLLIVDGQAHIGGIARANLSLILRPGDVVIANDAATMPASLDGRHTPTGQRIEIRLAGRRSLQEIRQFAAIVFGEGDFHVRTEQRAKPPALNAGDRLELGPLVATVDRVLNDHPRNVLLSFDGSAGHIWEGLARHGRPIQYAHIPKPLALWDASTAIAGPPVAFEPPSASFALDWRTLAAMASRGVKFGAITLAAGISSTGDSALDALLPFDEPYSIPPWTARLIAEGRRRGARVIAVGTSVVRALEHAAAISDGAVAAGEGMATQRIGPSSRLRLVNAILTGVHEAGSSHYELLRAFIGDEWLNRIDQELNARDFRTHEFGDSIFVERSNITKTRWLEARDFCALSACWI
jgi:S-adenosylmethionine:tRNA ribosyltransferase-isomerase